MFGTIPISGKKTQSQKQKQTKGFLQELGEEGFLIVQRTLLIYLKIRRKSSVSTR